MNRMDRNQKNTSLYLSPGKGTLESNGWMKNHMKKCYPEKTKFWIDEWRLNTINCGVLGGHKSVIQCLLNCITKELTQVVTGGMYCDEATLNWCIRFENCASKRDTEVDQVEDLFVNQHWKNCNDKRYSIIHNKC